MGPALVRVLAPRLRAMAPNLLTPPEHATLAQTCSVLLSYGLTYSLAEETAPGGGA